MKIQTISEDETSNDAVTESEDADRYLAHLTWIFQRWI